MTGLSFASADAIFDERGPNIPGSRDGIDMQQTKQFPLKKLLSREYHRTDEQNIEDAKQFGRAFGKEVANTPTEDDSKDILFGLVEKKVTEEDKRNFIKSKMKNRNFTSSKGFSALDKSRFALTQHLTILYGTREQENIVSDSKSGIRNLILKQNG